MNFSMSQYKFWPNNFLLIYFFMTLMLILNIMACMTSNLIFLWIMLEINFMIFIFSFMMTTKNTTHLTSFFLIQSISSLILIYLINFNSLLITKTFLKELFFITMAFKLGLWPFNWWPPMIMKKMNWMLIFSLSTLQKFIPLLMIKTYFINNNSNILILICLISLISSTMKAIFSNNIKVIFSYSSINNSSWMTMLILTDFYSFITYFIIYSLLMLLLSTYMNLMHINSMMNFNLINMNNNKIYTQCFIYSLLFSLSMIPPLCSFIIKVNASMNLIMNNLLIFTVILMICTTLSMIMYINIIFKTLIFFYSKPKFIYYSTFKSQSIMNSFISVILLMLIFYMTYLFI